jgi:hypothetical protein
MFVNLSPHLNKGSLNAAFFVLIAALLAACSVLVSQTSAAGEKKELPNSIKVNSQKHIEDPSTPVVAMIGNSNANSIGEKIKKIEANKKKEGDASFIEGEKMIAQYLSSKGKSIDRNSNQYQRFLVDVWLDGYPEISVGMKNEPILYYVVTVLGIEPAK